MMQNNLLTQFSSLILDHEEWIEFEKMIKEGLKHPAKLTSTPDLYKLKEMIRQKY